MHRLDQLKPIHHYSHIWTTKQAFSDAPKVHRTRYNSHNRNDLAVRIYENELYIPTVAPSQSEHPPPTRKSGDINTFSTKSRMRILHKFNRLQTTNLSDPIFCTFTAPPELAEPEEFQYRFKKKLLPALDDIVPNLVYAWRLEPHRSGHPHYHLFIWSWDQDRTLESRYYKDQIRDAWSEAFDCYNKEFRRYALDVKPVRNERKAMSYVTKYMAKEDDEKGKQIKGRRWGNSTNLPDVPIAEIEMSDKQRKQLVEAAKALLSAKSNVPDYVIEDISTLSDSFCWIPVGEIVMLLTTVDNLKIPPDLQPYL